MNRDARIVLLLCVAAIFSMTGFSSWPALLPELQAAWGLSGTGAGAIGGSYFAGYMLAVPVLSGLTDRIDARRVYVGACLLAAVGHFGFALFAGDLVSACLLQAIAGAGLAGTYMPGLKALTDRVGGARLPRYIAFYTSTFGIGAALSYAFSGWLGLLDWRAAFVFGGIGPCVAIALILRGLAPVAPHGGHVPGVAAQLAALKDRAVRGYVLGYAAHCWELFGLRSWIVGLLAFSATQGSLPLAPATAAALINLAGIPASILGNEFAGRHDRRRTILGIMLASGVLAWAVGAAASWPLALLALLAIYQMVAMADSAALTAGLVAVADPARRGDGGVFHGRLRRRLSFAAGRRCGARCRWWRQLRAGLDAGHRQPGHLVSAGAAGAQALNRQAATSRTRLGCKACTAAWSPRRTTKLWPAPRM